VCGLDGLKSIMTAIGHHNSIGLTLIDRLTSTVYRLADQSLFSTNNCIMELCCACVVVNRIAVVTFLE